MVRIHHKDCRFGFGIQLDFDSSGAGDKTRGKERVDLPRVEPDKNGLMKYIARRNHPRVVEGPYASTYYAANNDLQIPLINTTGPAVLKARGSIWYMKFANNLAASGMGGLEYMNGNHVFSEYSTKYCTKVDVSTGSWKKTSAEITKAYCEDEGNHDKNLRNLMGKQMNEITRGTTVPKDQGLYTMGGGPMHRISTSTPQACSVSSMYIEDVGTGGRTDEDTPVASRADDQATKQSASFSWIAIKKRYTDRDLAHESLNLYRWVVHHWNKKKKTVPQFFGFTDTPKWPLTEEYSKWVLALFKPWRGTIESLRTDESYVKTMELFLWDDDMPFIKRAAILRCMRGEKGVDTEGVDIAQGVLDLNHSPTEGRTNAENAEALAANMARYSQDADGEGDVQFSDDMERRILAMNRRHTVDYNWSASWTEEDSTALKRYMKSSAKERQRRILEDDLGDINLFDEHTHRPEGAQTEEQTFLVYHYLYYQRKVREYEERVAAGTYNNDDKRPPDQRVLVEGAPGSGKSWVINCLRNMGLKLHDHNLAVAATAPTGCAAAIINGETDFRKFHVPAGKRFLAAPTNCVNMTKKDLAALRTTLSMANTVLLDESSMQPRGKLGYIRHRLEENRRPCTVVDDNGAPLANSVDIITDPEIYDRPYGGLPFLYSFGDSKQLPPVKLKPFYDKRPGVVGKSDLSGKIAFTDFVKPNDEDEELSTVVYMNTVLRQSEPVLKRVLDHMREGTMTDEDVDFVFSRFEEDLPQEEKDNFVDALHLVPKWSIAHEIVYNYIKNDLETPIAVIKATYSTSSTNGKNCQLAESSFRNVMALCVGAKVMLLQNMIVAHKLMNGSTGVVKAICYPNKDGPFNCDGRGYAIVDFPECTIPEGEKLIPNMPRTYVPIPFCDARCECKQCTVSTIPLLVCVALSIHKAQGMTIGDGCLFEKLKIYMPTENEIAGQTLVVWTRAKKIADFIVSNSKAEISRRKIQRIGQGKPYEGRNNFQKEMMALSPRTMDRTIALIKEMDVGGGVKTYDGGCKELLRWYRATVGDGA
mmetsp:Transcript_3966/g.8935  ORF Transcript_3966/g.8935 Transcript_3966/m.8935 type:complete len:1042 (+) Transcript_3966:4059-7184(+)